MPDIYKKFRILHQQPGAFIIPNPWDVGSARILAAMGFGALATTSAGLAFSLGLSEGTVSIDAAIRHGQAIVEATRLPVSADLEKGYGDSPETAAATIQAAAAAGLAGCSLEDHTGRRDNPIFELSLAVERIQSAAEAARKLSHDFVLTARCENFLWERRNIDDTIKRLQAFERAGADVLYAPGLRDIETVRLICSSLTKPVNVVANANFSLTELADAGAKRISIGSSFARLAYGAFVNAACEIRSEGTFRFCDEAMAFDELEAFFLKSK